MSERKVVALESRTAEHIAPAAAIDVVISCRLMLMTLRGRNHPDLAPGVLFSELEIEVHKAFAAQQGFEAPETLAKTIRVVAQIGGYVYRPRGPPAPRSSGGAMQPSPECASDTLWQCKAGHDKNQHDGKLGLKSGTKVGLADHENS